MKVFINQRNEIVDVGSTTNSTLKMVEVADDTFDGWSVAKICCHKLILINEKYCGYVPFVDAKQIERIEAQEIVNTDVQLAIAELGLIISTMGV